MNKTTKINSFKSVFENLEIGVSEILLQKFEAIPSPYLQKDSGYTNVWEDLNVSYMGDNLNLNGKIYLYLKTQNENDMTSLFLDCVLYINANNETDKANVFTKALQFLFTWTENYIVENEVLSANGNQFIIPQFLYSKSHFENHFENK